ncbi:MULTISPECIES: hypothetical protein [Ramlibacter]|uniref:Uncharacterized protein n=1 Tax=Ramlibacter pinisoli TaxID=2682844 RepID=A0A6N8IZ27_9BURK|nr:MULTISPECIES: hypothetical protein [Ramlibacter]MBA2962302.1 hypothetical protein [Ramlibacter sp. CGMCC 1.13660]MVQ32244.1 hypothetical protein [Ramlibacter pinisoli]
MDEPFQRWHDVERAVMDLEKRLMIAQALEDAGSVRSPSSVLRQQLEDARAAAQRALDDCLRHVRQAP